MSFLKKLFGSSAPASAPKQDPVALEKLGNILRTLARPATKIELSAPTIAFEDSQLYSHFAGLPYFEEGEEWPKSKTGKQMDLVFQIFNDQNLMLPKHIKLIQFFYDFELFPWETEADGWKIKIYETLRKDKMVRIDKPVSEESLTFCEVSFKPVISLPDWEGIQIYSKEVSDLAEKIDKDNQWDVYDSAVEKIVSEPGYRTQFGGYATWVQNEGTPQDSKGNNIKLLFQVDSEDKAGLMWGDAGLFYAFYDEETGKMHIEMQCH